jgi:hypothetical protein
VDVLNLKQYTVERPGWEDEVFLELDKIQSGELLEREGVFSFFYENITDPSTTLFLKSSKEVRFFYVDHDDFLYDIMELVPAWNLDVIENVLKINMIFNLQGNVIAIPFNFDLKKEVFRNALIMLGESGKFSITYMSILYGGFVFEKKVDFALPQSIIDTLNTLK